MKLLAELLSEKVHTLRNPDIKPRGAPEEKARVFDEPGTDRSAIKTLKQYDAIEGSNEGDFLQCLVMGGSEENPVTDLDIFSGKYSGINVLFMANGNIESSTGDRISKDQWKADKDKIIATAKKFFGADKIAAFVKRGGDGEKRKPDDAIESDPKWRERAIKKLDLRENLSKSDARKIANKYFDTHYEIVEFPLSSKEVDGDWYFAAETTDDDWNHSETVVVVVSPEGVVKKSTTAKYKEIGGVLHELFADQGSGHPEPKKGKKPRWIIEVKRADGKVEQKKCRAWSQEAVENHYGKDLVSVYPDPDDLEEEKSPVPDRVKAPPEALLRGKLIDRIEGYFGTLESVPYDKISTPDLQKIVDTLIEMNQIKPLKEQQLDDVTEPGWYAVSAKTGEVVEGPEPRYSALSAEVRDLDGTEFSCVEITRADLKEDSNSDIIGYVDPLSVKSMKAGNLGAVSIWPKKGKGKTLPVCAAKV